jgi:hypothetical protein
MVAVLGPYEALPYYIHTYIHIIILELIYRCKIRGKIIARSDQRSVGTEEERAAIMI